ncbi:uracil-DNA glycosylase [Bordetella genomosp. 11]|nr:uracil-DNA glycosylase family protein [Bordetella genomosp. 11]
MAEATGVPAKAPVLNPLQRAWLREIGMEKVWLRQEAPQPAATAAGDAAAASAPAARAQSAAQGRAGAVAPDTAPGGAIAPPAPGAPAAASIPGAASSVDTAAGVDTASGSMPASDVQPSSGGQPASRPGAPARRPVIGPRPAPSSTPAARSAMETPPQPAPTAESLAMLDMATLRERVLECTACGLCRGRRQAVFGMGPEQARWLVVGEAPGEQEDRQGLPFVGRSGQLLDAMLAAVGMSRDRDVYIANVIKCRPPGNRNPKPEEIAACRPYLMRQIALLKPERILVLGRFAAQTLLETDAAIGSLRGRVHVLKTPDGEIPMVVSYHPAYLLRSPVEKARAWQDLRLAAGLALP